LRAVAALHLLRAESLFPGVAGDDRADVVAGDRGAVLRLLGSHRALREECNAAAAADHRLHRVSIYSAGEYRLPDTDAHADASRWARDSVSHSTHVAKFRFQ